MAVGKRRTRRLMVAGQSFRWRCEFHYSYEQFSASYAMNGKNWAPDCLVIRPEEGAHRVLTVTWPACHGPTVLPGLVSACVEEALRRGWLTEQPTMTLEGSDVAITE